MSGDVQPRKRKDKKKKKDEPTLDDSRGTAAVLGEGDVFLHSHSDHGTGGHWCAKIIFFSLLAVLVTLIGLIIIENRGLSELEANAVESRYSGILEGWIEDAPDDDHHDIHTLELNHHGDEPEEEDDHDDGFEDGGSEEDNDSKLDPIEGDEDSQELEAAETEEVEYRFKHQEDEVEDEDNGHDDEDEETDNEEVTETPVESYYDYFFGSQKPQEDVLGEEGEDDEIDFDDPKNNNGGDTADSNDNDDNDDENYGNEYENDYTYAHEEDQNQDDNSFQSDYDNQIKNDIYDSTYHVDDKYESDDDNNEWEINENADENLEPEYDSDYDKNYKENVDQEEDDDHDDDHDDEDDDEETEEVEVEKIEKEVDDQEPIDIELPPLPEEDADSADEKDDDGDSNANDDNDDDEDDDDDDKDDDDDDDDDFLEHDDIFEEPIVERITVPAGKPYVEVDDDDSTEQSPVNTLAEEEEYERRQEEVRKREAEASHVWLKLGVGAALLVATHAVIKRATSRDEVNSEENEDREDTPSTTDRRMTLITEATNDDLETQEAPISRLERQVFQQIPHIVKSAPTPLQVSMDDDNNETEEDDEQQIQEEEVVGRSKTPEVELYSDEEIEENIIEPIKETLVLSAFKKHTEPPEEKQLPSDEDMGEEEEDDDVEIIGDEQIEEEEVEELDDEDISDVDDAELLSRLEAKYGSLSDPEKAPTKHKDGGDSVDDAWPGEPNDPFWKKEVDKAEDELEQGQWSAAIGRASSPQLAKSSRALYIAARAYDQLAEEKRDNKILTIAINAYVELLKNSDRIPDKKLLEITNRTIDRMHFRGTYISTEPIHRLLIRRFPDNVGYRNNFTVSFLMANRIDLAENVLKETLKKWPNDRVALAHYGFILKTHYNRLEDALEYLTKALENDTGPATEPRFYFHLGDALILLGRFDEAHEVHKRATKLGHFLSPFQRSLYNVKRLKGKPWWEVNETPYERLAKSLEQNWRAILKEGLAAKALYEQEKEGLREKGEWSQLDLFVRGFEVGGRCSRAPVTCAAVRTEPAAVGCRRGQIKFSSMEPGTRVRPHVGPTNCRLRMHLGLSNTKGTYIRVHKETRQWQEGKVFIFDDSFEHEVWHNGTGSRLVLIVDVWHPDLTPQERRTLPAI